MRMLDHVNVLRLKDCFFSTTDKDELYLNLVLEYVPETVYRVSKNFIRMHQYVPIIYVQLYIYQVNLKLSRLALFGFGLCFLGYARYNFNLLLPVCYFCVLIAHAITPFSLVDMPCTKLFA